MTLFAGFLLYCVAATAVILYLIVAVAPVHGNSNIFVYLAICSLVGSLSVMSVKVSSTLQSNLRASTAFLPLATLLNEPGCCHAAGLEHCIEVDL
jgi:hypothetical protein